MGNQSGTGKPGGAPNPNYGSGAGTDNSNGITNASRAYDPGLGAGAPTNGRGVQPTTLPPPAYGATGASGSGTGVADQGNTTGQTLVTPTNLYGATGAAGNYTTQNAGMGGKAQGGMGGKPTNAQPPGGMTTTVNAAVPYSTTYAPPPPSTLTPAYGATSAPMSGTNLGTTGAGGKAGAKGGTPGAPGGNDTVGSLLDRLTGGGAGAPPGATGTSGATGVPGGGTGGPRDYAAESGRFNAQNDPTGAWAKYYNNIQAGHAEAANAPDWMKKALAGTDMNGGTLAQRALSEQTVGPDTGATTKDWKSIVRKMSGESDPYKALTDVYAMAQKEGKGGQEKIRAALAANGLDKSVGDRLHEMFASGTDHQGAARRLGIEDEFLKATGGTQEQRDAAKALADWHKANPNAGAENYKVDPNAISPFTGKPVGATGSTTGTGATGATGPLVGGRNATGATGAVPSTDATTGAPVVAGAPMPGGAPEPTPQQITDIARKYMVSPEIARQIYRAILQQSMSSGGGRSNNSGSGNSDGGDGGDSGGDSGGGDGGSTSA